MLASPHGDGAHEIPAVFHVLGLPKVVGGGQGAAPGEHVKLTSGVGRLTDLINGLGVPREHMNYFLPVTFNPFQRSTHAFAPTQ